MRSLRNAARKVAVFHLPCGILIDEALTARGPAVEPCHVGFGPEPAPAKQRGLVDGQNQPRGVDALLAASPTRSVTRYVRIDPARARDERLFLSVTPRRRKKRLIIEVSALTPRSASNRSAKRLKRDVGFPRLSALREILDAARVSDGGIRPFCSPLREPLRSKRCTHLIADDSLTPNRAAAAHAGSIPPRITASITRSRKSCENMLKPSLAGLRPASKVESKTPPDSRIPRRFKLACSSL